MILALLLSIPLCGLLAGAYGWYIGDPQIVSLVTSIASLLKCTWPFILGFLVLSALFRKSASVVPSQEHSRPEDPLPPIVPGQVSSIQPVPEKERRHTRGGFLSGLRLYHRKGSGGSFFDQKSSILTYQKPNGESIQHELHNDINNEEVHVLSTPGYRGHRNIVFTGDAKGAADYLNKWKEE